MSILLSEQIVGFREAAKLLPARRNGRKPHVTTFYRWRDQGLETIQIGGQLCTSVEALERFFQRLAESKGKPESRPRDHEGTRKARRTQSRVEAALSEYGL